MITDQADEDLMVMYQKGEVRAFEVLLSRHRKPVYNFILRFVGDRETAARVDDLLARLRLDRIALANPFTLSGGEKRRLSVAAVLAARPSVLVLDEPTFGQDRITWLELTALLRELVDEGLTLLSVTHDAAYIAALGDRGIRLEPTNTRAFA